MNIVRETKVHTNMMLETASMQMAQNILFMTNIKKIIINENLEDDKTGRESGNVYLNRISENLSTDELKSYFIKFEKGSKSKIHLHDSDQIIIGMKGIGQIVTFSKINDHKFKIDESLELGENESVLIPSGTPHWHGATENHSSSQLSFMKSGKTFWF
ncbi:cupin domain-containing protein [Nitrosopumilus sp.]|uniref:cupin domain-containing protein n=1 Tax=Nitrosopumilus sp. TaxID=2024843 RepID=UPI00247E2D48|nr:cupin domain-containing protein [Nitrosopumilus sp.]MCV0410433.1 hypothetical protein [Nitrosopumilus sp.]